MKRHTLGLLAALALALPSVSALAAPPAPASAPAVEKHGRTRPALHGVLNLNNADAATLELLPGIGPTKADRIVEWRHAHPFKRVEELDKVKGIGRKTVQRLRPFLAVSGNTTLAEETIK
jgi:competence protein ComEA